MGGDHCIKRSPPNSGPHFFSWDKAPNYTVDSALSIFILYIQLWLRLLDGSLKQTPNRPKYYKHEGTTGTNK